MQDNLKEGEKVVFYQFEYSGKEGGYITKRYVGHVIREFQGVDGKQILSIRELQNGGIFTKARPELRRIKAK